jgi:predicted DNA-binding protein
MISRKPIESKMHTTLQVRIPMALDNQLQKAQIETGQTVSKIIRQALEGSLKDL